MPKLYELSKRNIMVRLLEDAKIPPEHGELLKGQVVKFGHIDGMYSLCWDQEGNLIHPAAWTECEVLE